MRAVASPIKHDDDSESEYSPIVAAVEIKTDAFDASDSYDSTIAAVE
jgi:hypothetical protein